jgi:hypothetical protein
MVLSIILISSSALMNNLVDAQKFEQTVAEMKQLGDYICGDPNMMQTGHLADLGYFEAHRNWPANVSQLYEFIFEPMSVRQIVGTVAWHELLQDEWGVGYNFTPPAATNNAPPPFTLQIESAGPNRGMMMPNHGDNIIYRVTKNLYEGNFVRIMVTDAAGTVLRARVVNTEGFHHLYAVELRGYGSPQAYSGRTGLVSSNMAPLTAMTYSDGYFEVGGVTAGAYMITVQPTPGPVPPLFVLNTDHGNYKLTDNLCGVDPANTNQETAIRKMIMVTPRGSATRQYFVVKLPGLVDPKEVGDYDA